MHRTTPSTLKTLAPSAATPSPGLRPPSPHGRRSNKLQFTPPRPHLYKPGTWLTTFGDMADTSIRTWKSSLEDCHALERGIGHVVASGVCAVGQSVEGEF